LLVCGLDRRLVLRVADLLAGFGVEDERAVSVLPRRELRGKQVAGRLAVGAWKAEIVARVRPDDVRNRQQADDEDNPRPEDDPLAAGREEAKPMQPTRRAKKLLRSDVSLNNRRYARPSG
jgi:hypothetical protein